MLFLGYDKCSTSNKAKKFLEEHNVSFTFRDITKDNPTYEELKKWYSLSGLPIRKLFNTSGLLYKELQLKEKLPQMSEVEMLTLLATDGKLVKRPVLVLEDKVFFGFRQEEWESLV